MSRFFSFMIFGVLALSGSAAMSARADLISDVLQSPVYMANASEVQEQAYAQLDRARFIPEDLRSRIRESIAELPFHRIIDIELIFPGIPDILGLCLEGHPGSSVAIEACASTAIFLSSLTAMVKYQPTVAISQSASGSIHQLNFGPGVGVRRIDGLCFDACPVPQLYGDLVLSLEYVFWMSQHFGFKTQLDLGATFELTQLSSASTTTTATAAQTTIIPLGKLTIGFAF